MQLRMSFTEHEENDVDEEGIIFSNEKRKNT